MALSDAATVNNSKPITCPNKSSKKIEEIAKRIIDDNIKISNEINIIIKCFLDKNIPHIPRKNNIKINIINQKKIFNFKKLLLYVLKVDNNLN